MLTSLLFRETLWHVALRMRGIKHCIASQTRKTTEWGNLAAVRD